MLQHEYDEVKDNGVEYTVKDPTEMAILRNSEKLEDYKIRLAPDLLCMLDGKVTYFEAKEPQGRYNFYPETLGLVFAITRQQLEGIRTIYAIKLIDSIRLFDTAKDNRVLSKTEKLWYKPQYHPLDAAAWQLIKMYWQAGIFGKAWIDTDLAYNRPNDGSVSGDLCNVIPQNALQSLPRMEQYA